MSDQSHAPYLEALRAHAALDPERLYVPGHKGGAAADPELREAIGEKALALDIPALTPGIDVGPPDPTPFQEAQRLAAEAWGAERTWFLGNGASQANHVALLALAHAGDRVVVQRNAHSSTVDGCILAGLTPRFVAPEVDPDRGIAHCLAPGDAGPGAHRHARRGGRHRRLADLLRRGGRRGRPGRCGPLARRAAGGRRGLGRAPDLPPRPARAGARRWAPTWSSPAPTRSSAR